MACGKLEAPWIVCICRPNFFELLSVSWMAVNVLVA